MGHHDRLVVEGDVVVRILPGGGGRRRAAPGVGVGIILERADQPFPDLGVIDQQLAVVVDQLDVVGVDPAQERLEGVGRLHAHREAGAEQALAGGLADAGLDLVAPEGPVLLPRAGNVAFLEAGLGQHVLPILDVQRLLLDREGVVGLLLGLVAVEEGRLDRVGREAALHRPDDVGDVVELAVERPLAGGLHVVGVGIGNVGNRAGIERRHRLRIHVLHGVLRELDLHAGLGLELLDRCEQRLVFGFIKAFHPPHGELFLGETGGCRQGDRHSEGAGQYTSHSFPLGLCRRPPRTYGRTDISPLCASREKSAKAKHTTRRENRAGRDVNGRQH